jgi:hypothetical protein
MCLVGTLIGRCAPGAACAYGIALGLIIVIRAVRSASATATAFAASFAVLRFEPHTTMPPSNAATAAAIAPHYAKEHREKDNTAAPRSDPRDQDELAAALDLSSKLFDERLKADNLIVGIAVSFVIRIVVDVFNAAHVITATYECSAGTLYPFNAPPSCPLLSVDSPPQSSNTLWKT